MNDEEGDNGRTSLPCCHAMSVEKQVHRCTACIATLRYGGVLVKYTSECTYRVEETAIFRPSVLRPPSYE